MRGVLSRCAEILNVAKDLNAAKDLGEPRDVARCLRHNNRAFGSLPSSAVTHIQCL
jgi:hypothetical protein